MSPVPKEWRRPMVAGDAMGVLLHSNDDGKQFTLRVFKNKVAHPHVMTLPGGCALHPAITWAAPPDFFVPNEADVGGEAIVLATDFCASPSDCAATPAWPEGVFPPAALDSAGVQQREVAQILGLCSETVSAFVSGSSEHRELAALACDAWELAARLQHTSTLMGPAAAPEAAARSGAGHLLAARYRML
eukprot:gene16489-19579_t